MRLVTHDVPAVFRLAGISRRDAVGEHGKEWKGREDDRSTPLAFRIIEHCDRSDDQLRQRGVGGSQRVG